MTFFSWLRLLVAVVFYIPKAVTVIALKLLTLFLAPLLALPVFVRMADETQTTGHPSQFPGKLRAFLIKPLMGFQTHDDCLDAFWYSGKYKSSWLKRFNQHDFDTKWYVRYFNYVAWLWRNPAYQFAHWLGWRNTGVKKLWVRDRKYLWKTGVTNFSGAIVTNDKGSVSFEFEGQWHFKGPWALEWRFGYGYERKEPDGRCMLNVRFIPWRKYELKP